MVVVVASASQTCPTPQAVKARLVAEFERYNAEMAVCEKEGRACKPRCLVLDGSAFALIEDAPITSIHGPVSQLRYDTIRYDSFGAPDLGGDLERGRGLGFISGLVGAPGGMQCQCSTAACPAFRGRASASSLSPPPPPLVERASESAKQRSGCGFKKQLSAAHSPTCYQQ